jgi:hypothetical protein
MAAPSRAATEWNDVAGFRRGNIGGPLVEQPTTQVVEIRPVVTALDAARVMGQASLCNIAGSQEPCHRPRSGGCSESRGRFLQADAAHTAGRPQTGARPFANSRSCPEVAVQLAVRCFPGIRCIIIFRAGPIARSEFATTRKPIRGERRRALLQAHRNALRQIGAKLFLRALLRCSRRVLAVF